jgi:glycosyltransferase involved in cell wall biosynthesis
MSKISIIIPTYNEEKYISNCLDSILSQDYSEDTMEVLIIDGMSKDNTRNIVSEYCKHYSFIKLLDNPDKSVPHALNIGIKTSHGEVIIRIDGHCEYPINYISTLVRFLYELNADNVGGVWNTLPAKDNSICRAIAIGSSHKFGVGNSKHKVGVSKIIQTETVPFGCYHRDVFSKIGLFDEELIRNQDDEFNARLIKSGGKIFLIPSIVINYIARDSVRKMSKMYYQYGLFKPLVNKKLGVPATIRQFFPIVFLVGLIFGAILSLYSLMFLILYIIMISLYVFLAILFSVTRAVKNKDWKLIFILPFVFFTIHVSYGIGYLVGIYNIIMKREFYVYSNR